MANLVRRSLWGLALVSLGGLGCSASSGSPNTNVSSSGGSSAGDGAAGSDGSSSDASSDAPAMPLASAIENIVIIYAENRTFDNMFGKFPGAHDLS